MFSFSYSSVIHRDFHDLPKVIGSNLAVMLMGFMGTLCGTPWILFVRPVQVAEAIPKSAVGSTSLT